VIPGCGTAFPEIERPRSYPDPMADQPRIELIFAPEEAGGYHVYVPDLPGLHTQGDTLEEALANAEEALELYVEGIL